MKCSIWIPTYQRGSYLRDALESVRKQSGLSNVVEILVSENSTNVDSEAVCVEFSDLPIRYYLNPSPSAPGTPDFHCYWWKMLDSLTGDYVAILHDDDWWDESHLERGLRHLSQTPAASVYYGAIAFCHAPDGYVESVYGTVFPSVFSDSKAGPICTLSNESVLLSCLFLTNYVFSSLVVRKQIVCDAFLDVCDTNDYDIDRELAVRLALHGDLIYDSEIHVYGRLHADSEALRVRTSGAAEFHWNNTTERLVALADQKSICVHSLLTDRLNQHSQISNLVRNYSSPHSLQWLTDRGFIAEETKPKLSLFERVARALLPPIFVRLYAYASLFIKSRQV